MRKFWPKNRIGWAIVIIWLFHVSAIIGILAGHFEWFIEKTPLNLVISLFLFFWVYPVNTFAKVLTFCIFFFGGIVAEALGVNFGLLFGDYVYGENLGPKLYGIPYLIGALWALLTFACAGTAELLVKSRVARVLLATVLMVGLDFFMEHSAHQMDFWTFEGNLASLENYVSWFFLSLIFQMILQIKKVKGNRILCVHLYSAQLVFFLLFYLLPIHSGS